LFNRTDKKRVEKMNCNTGPISSFNPIVYLTLIVICIIFVGVLYLYLRFQERGGKLTQKLKELEEQK